MPKCCQAGLATAHVHNDLPCQSCLTMRIHSQPACKSCNCGEDAQKLCDGFLHIGALPRRASRMPIWQPAGMKTCSIHIPLGDSNRNLRCDCRKCR